MTRTLALIALMMTCGAALAHPGHEHVGGLGAGLAHPFMGLDHLLAMLAVGVWAAQWRGMRVCIAPSIFIVCMLLGALYALQIGTLPYVEQGIALSVLALGLLIAFVPIASADAMTALGVIALAAALHGHAHGAELPSGATAAHYMAGFAIGTAALHLIGIALGGWLRTRLALRRCVGVALSIAGTALTVAL